MKATMATRPLIFSAMGVQTEERSGPSLLAGEASSMVTLLRATGARRRRR